MGDFVNLFGDHLTRKQIRNVVQECLKRGYLTFEGKGFGTYYFLSKTFKKKNELISRALSIGIEELQKRGEIKKG